MKYYRAAIRTAGMTAGVVYEVDPDSEPSKGLIEAGYLVPLSKAEEKNLDIEPVSIAEAQAAVDNTDADKVVTPATPEPTPAASSAAKGDKPK